MATHPQHFLTSRKRRHPMNRVSPSALILVGMMTFLSPSRADEAGSKPKVWMIAIGIDRYEDSSIPRCAGAGRDSRAIAEWLTGQAGWEEKQLLRMDELGRRKHGEAASPINNLLPTRENLEWALVEWLGYRVRKDDIVVFYFAGQANARPPQPGQSTGRAYLLPIDARRADIGSSGWSLDDALDKAKRLAEKKARVVLWLDTSTAGRGEVGTPIEKGAPSGQDWLQALTRWPGVTAWIAADVRPAAEGKAGEPSPFVAGLLNSLGTNERAHNLLGCLKGMGEEPTLRKQGFRSMGGVGPAVSLWSGGALVVEEAVPELIIQAGHGDRVTAVLVTADNAHAITASQDSTVRVWNLADRSLLRVLTDPLVGVEALALDRDGSVLIAGDGTGRVFGWDMTLDRPRPFYGPAEHKEGIVDIAFLAGGKTFLTRDRARRSVLWDASQGAIKKLRTFSEESLGRLATAASPEPGAACLVTAVEPPAGGPGWLLSFDASGKQVARVDGPGGRISALDFSSDGRLVAVGDDKGRVVVLDLSAGSTAYSGQFDGTIRLAQLSRAGQLLVADDRTLRLIEVRNGATPVVLMDAQGVAVTGEVDRSAFSNDGRWLAACTPDGKALAWRLNDPAKPRPVALPSIDAVALSPAFSHDGRTLLIGDADGGLRAWGLDEMAGVPKAAVRPRIAPSRGKVAALVPSPTGRYLLEITKDDLALIWDLQEGRGCKPLPGSWTSGAFLPDESKLLLTVRPDEGGDVVLVDRLSGLRMPTRFVRPTGPDGRPSTAAFGSLVVSKTGRWAAAASLEGQIPLACVWDVADGKLVHTATDHDRGLTAVDLSGDESYLVTASEDGMTKVWSMADPAVDLHKTEATFSNPAETSPAITSARFCPGNSGRIVTGTRGGYVFLWEWEPKKRGSRVDLGQLDGEVNATTFSPDGRWVAASGALDKLIRFWSIPQVGRPLGVRFSPTPHHGEQVGALATWPNGSMIVSGGDDSTVRFWDLKDHALIGTLVAQGRDDKAVDWLAFTPEGLFDGSLPGEAMVKWRVGDRIVTLQQSEDTHHVFQLAGAFAQGEKPKGPELKDQSPRLKIDTPPTDRTVEDREVEVIIWTGDSDPEALRLYQNGVPVKGKGDFNPGAGPNFLKTKVTLRRGDNRFYAMASRPGAIDGSTDERTLRYEGPDPPGRVHILAIGVGSYPNRPLKYPNADAERIAGFLHDQATQSPQKPGECIVLTDADVTPDKIENAFRRLRDVVKGKPEDTVVLFLAGHTDTDTRNEQFCLLLPDFPFKAAPTADPAAASPFLGVAMRGNPDVGSFATRVGEQGVLPYVLLYNRLTRLEALQRLVIVDACQAGAILEDPAVRNILRLVEKGSRKARNSYLLAARRGEPASEADALEHGLLTYTLLHGLKATGLKLIPEDLGGFPGKPSADLNLDGIVTSDELVAYTDDALPRLTRLFPQVVMRAGNSSIRRPSEVDGGSPELEAKLKLQVSEGSFPLIATPK